MLAFKTLALALSLLPGIFAASAPRIDKDKAALLVVDHQVGLFELVQDINPVEFRNNIVAHAELGFLFNLPTILTTSAETGPNGPLPKEITRLHPNATFVRRNGEVNAWSNEEFRAAVKATNKSQIILAGITTDVCTAFLALSLIDEGYEVFANADASGTFNKAIADGANDRMRGAGVQVLSFWAIVCELMRDWRNTPGAAEVLPFLDKYLPAYGYLARGHAAATTNGTILPGQGSLNG
ncbi:ycaC protein [Coprinellus micaceus]|uniref:YcaC protein n=1 Tax=Coprinellus micaceus TaxID=71717 RepID=A0A4Y7TNR3_COPMI|nr:ycaC protein [Coprinellus micaceus]